VVTGNKRMQSHRAETVIIQATKLFRVMSNETPNCQFDGDKMKWSNSPWGNLLL